MKLWIARDKQGQIGLYYKKPNWRICVGYKIADWLDGRLLGYLEDNEFPEVTFENSPQEVELKLIENK